MRPTRRSLAVPRARSGSDGLDQPIFPFQGVTVIAKYGGPGWVDRPGAPLHRLADRHHRGDPGNRDSEAEEAEEQADRRDEHCQRAGALTAERPSMSTPERQHNEDKRRKG